jgi:hypothetical protein
MAPQAVSFDVFGSVRQLMILLERLCMPVGCMDCRVPVGAGDRAALGLPGAKSRKFVVMLEGVLGWSFFDRNLDQF